MLAIGAESHPIDAKFLKLLFVPGCEKKNAPSQA
jgi:hypothetical protein